MTLKDLEALLIQAAHSRVNPKEEYALRVSAEIVSSLYRATPGVQASVLDDLTLAWPQLRYARSLIICVNWMAESIDPKTDPAWASFANEQASNASKHFSELLTQPPTPPITPPTPIPPAILSCYPHGGTSSLSKQHP